MKHVDPEKHTSELERQLAERGTAGADQYQIPPDSVHNVGQPELPAPPKPAPQPAALRQRLQLARGLIHVTDPDGVDWKVYRRWFPNWSLSWLHGADPGDLGAYLFAVLWPPWFFAKLLGVKWVIVIERTGGEMGDERVRGWRRSQRRVRELAASAAAGTILTELKA